MSSHIYTDSDFTTALIKDVNKRKKLTVVFAVGGSMILSADNNSKPMILVYSVK